MAREVESSIRKALGLIGEPHYAPLLVERARRSATDAGGEAIHQRGSGQRTWCFIYEPAEDEIGDDTEYPVILYSGRVEEEGSGGNIKREIDKVRNLKLEVMFVVESTGGDGSRISL